MNKSAIRQIYKEKRLALTAELIDAGSKAVADNFVKNLLPQIENFENQKLAFYIATNNEVDPIYIINHCSNKLCLPKIVSNSLVLEFKEYKIGDELDSHTTYTKLKEPKNSPSIIPDIIFVPLIAFDKKRNRIGMGGGFYDATIQNFRKNYPKTIFIGLGYDIQEHPLIDALEHDQSLDFIVSESSVLSHSQYSHG